MDRNESVQRRAAKAPWNRDELRFVMNGIGDVADEWAGIMGEPAEGSEQWEFQQVLNEISWKLSRLSFSLHVRGLEAAEPGDLPQP